jgi:hypothetical protein
MHAYVVYGVMDDGTDYINVMDPDGGRLMIVDILGDLSYLLSTRAVSDLPLQLN